jgi:deoxyribonuclease-4
MNLGAHMSIAGGVHRAIARAEEVGATALQIFTRNQRRWTAPPLSGAAVEAFRRARAESTVGAAVAHASYLVNLASPDDALHARSLTVLRDELERAEALGLDALVVHPGAHMGGGADEGLRRIAAGVREILHGTAGFRCRLAFETTTGGGSHLGSTFEELARLLATCGEIERLGICIDTCHVFAAGYDLRDASAYRKTRRLFDSIVGLSHVVAIHLNDSAGKLGGRLDRHAHIGRGRIGAEGFRALLRDDKLAHVPKLLETPKEGTCRGKPWDVENLRVLRALRDG